MEVSNDDVMVNNTACMERLVGDECRVCLKTCMEARQLFHNDDEIPKKLMAIAAVQVEEGDGLPASICSSCNHLLDLSYDFKCQIQSSDVKLREILQMQNKDIKDAALIKDIIGNVMSDVTYCKKHNHIEEQNLYSSHDIVTFDDANTIQCDATVNSESCVTHEFMQKPQEIVDRIGKDAQYDTLKDNVHNTEMIEVALCHETHTDDVLDQSDRSSGSIMEDKCIKQEDQLILPEDNQMTSESLVNDSKEDTLKMEIKNDVSLEDFENHDVAKQSAMLGMNSQDTKSITNCSDDEEEKPLISRTLRLRCLHCIKTFATKTALQRHMIVHKHKTKLRYVCYMCDKQFSNIAKLKSHVLDSHKSHAADTKASQEETQEEKRASKSSAKITRSSSNVIDATKEEKKTKICKVCSKQFIYQKSFLSHAKTHPEYNEETPDDVFDQSANTATSEQKDNKTPTFRENESEEEEEEEDDDDSDLPIESLQCTQCGKLFATKRNLKRHISTHSGLKFNCSTCGKGFSRIDKLKDHEQSKHKEEIFGNTDDEDDDEEDNENKVNENSESRKKDRHNRPHKCAHCPKAFAQAQSLANHVERHNRVKDTQKRFLCEKCSKCFAQSGSLVAHMRTHTGVKPYVCNVCSRAFTKSTYLQLHLRTHSGEKPYICQYCSRAFARANTLARHITMHTGEAKYHCSICAKSFRRLTSLNEHTYTHTGQRPYACKLCTKRYNNAGSLYAHTKKCKAQQMSGSTTTATFAVSAADSMSQQNDASMPQLLIYSQRKLEDATVTQVAPTTQYMVANVHNQKTMPANVIQPFTVEDPNVYNAKQFKNPYYAIYPNM